MLSLSGSKRRQLGIPILLVAVLAGCGGSAPQSDPDAIAKVLKDAAGAVADRDGDKACGYLTAEAQQQVVQLAGGAFGGTDCAGVVKLVSATFAPLDRKQIEDAEPQNITVTGTTASAVVVVPNPSNQGPSVQVTLQKVGSDWKIASVQL
jgi:hypothetical protein